MDITFPIDINKPFAFYDDLLFNHSIRTVIDLFYKESKITENHHLIMEKNQDFIFERWIGNEDISDMIDIEKHFKLVLENNSKQAFKTLNDYLEGLDDVKKKTFLNSQLNLLDSCIEKNKTEKWNNFSEIIQNELFNVINNIKIKYTHLISYHKVFVKITDNTSKINSFFQPKPDIKRSFFKQLYDIVIDMDLVDDIIITEDVFIDVFTSAKPHSDSRIVFTKTNPIVAWFLKKIEPFFNNLNAVTIEKSKCFFNKQNKPLRATDLYAAISRGRNRNQDYFNRIDQSIAELKTTHLT